MASVNWMKSNVQTVCAMAIHNGRRERVECNHTNTDIDKSKSHLNIYIGADDWSAMADKVKNRVEEVDKEHPPLRDTGKERVTCFLLETPVPQEIAEQGKAEEFLRKAHKVLEDFFGAENVGGTVGHFDEQHYYTDKDGKERLSLIHGHSPIAAYVEWTEDIKKNVKQPDGRYKQVKTGETRERCGINGKHCESKARLTALNKAMEEMCRREYGISYNTGETPQRKNVERLKRESELRREESKLKQAIAQSQLVLDNIAQNVAERRSTLSDIQGRVDALTGDERALQASVDRLHDEYDKFRADVAEEADEYSILLMANYPPPTPPAGERPVPWEIYIASHPPCGRGGKPYKENTRRYNNAVEQIHAQYDAINAQWVQYDALYAAWRSDMNELGVGATLKRQQERIREREHNIESIIENRVREQTDELRADLSIAQSIIDNMQQQINERDTTIAEQKHQIKLLKRQNKNQHFDR